MDLCSNTACLPKGHEYTWVNIKFINSLYVDQKLLMSNSEKSSVDIEVSIIW